MSYGRLPSTSLALFFLEAVFKAKRERKREEGRERKMVESSQTGISLMHGPGAPSAPDLLRSGEGG